MSIESKNSVSVAIVTWNSAEHLSECLQSLKTQTHPSIEVIVVDNASIDDSLAIVERMMPEATIIRKLQNTGFCGGHNTAIAAAHGEFYLPLNPDVEMAPTFVEALVQAMQTNDRIGTVVGKLYLEQADAEHSQSIIDETGLFMNRARRQYLRGHQEKEQQQYEEARYVFGASGAAPLYRRTMLEDIKIEGDFFDSDFFAHKEDVDLSWRSQLLGWRTYYTPQAVARHHRHFRPHSDRHKIAADVKVHAIKNRYLTIIKNDLPRNLLADLPWIIGYDTVILAYVLLFERRSLQGFAQAFKLVPHALRKRQAIMRKRQMSAQEIRKAMFQ